MKKKEIIAMVGEKNVGGWWNLGRIVLAIIAAVSVVGIVFILFGFDFKLDVGMRGLYILLLLLGIWEAYLVFSMCLICSRTVHAINLKVEKINENGTRTKVEVLGKDSNRHDIHVSRMWFRKSQKTSYVHLSGNLNCFWSDLVIGSNISEVWEKPKKK